MRLHGIVTSLYVQCLVNSTYSHNLWRVYQDGFAGFSAVAYSMVPFGVDLLPVVQEAPEPLHTQTRVQGARGGPHGMHRELRQPCINSPHAQHRAEAGTDGAA